MNRPLLAPLLLFLVAPLLAHGGAFTGPGGGAPADSVPPPPRGGGGGTPAGGPSSTPSGGLASCSRTINRSSLPGTPPMDETVWQRWWGFNQHAYLDVKGAIHAAELVAGSDEFFLGRAPADHARDRMQPSQERIRAEVVPALRRALAHERDADVVTGALIALAKIGDLPGEDSIARVIEPFLADDNQEIAETAAVALGILATPAAAPLLAGLLGDTQAGRERTGHPSGVPLRSRAFAAYGLGLVASRNEHPTLRRWVVRTLIEAFEQEARDLATPDVAVACLGALSLVPLQPGADAAAPPWTGLEPQLRWLRELVGDDDLRELTRAHAPVAVARLLAGASEAERASHLQLLCADLARRGTPRLVRQGLVLALGQVASTGATPEDRVARSVLLEISRGGGDLDQRHYAIIALGQVAARVGCGADPLEGRALLRGRLVDSLQGGSSLDRPWAALGLGALGRGLADADQEPEPAVGAALRTALAGARSPRDVGALAIACGMRRDALASEGILAQLGASADDETRGYLCLALGMIGAPEGLEPVRRVVRAARYRPALLRQGAVALGLLGDKHLVPELCETLERAGSLAAQASVASGLGAIGDARSIQPLVHMLGDADITPRARAFAAVALGIVADKEPRPWNAKLAIGNHYRANPVTLTDGQGAGILELL